MNRIEKCHRILCLVRLQLTHKMEFHVRELGTQPRPFGLCFLHPVFAKAAMAGFEQRADCGCIMRL